VDNAFMTASSHPPKQLPLAPEPAPGEATLANPAWEIFAKRRAAGATQVAAYAAAGYAGGPRCANRLANRPEVAARVAFLRRQTGRGKMADLEATIVALLDLADAADCATPGGLREARLARIDARRLHVMLLRERMGHA
jgi:dienelactone hydrolase